MTQQIALRRYPPKTLLFFQSLALECLPQLTIDTNRFRPLHALFVMHLQWKPSSPLQTPRVAEEIKVHSRRLSESKPLKHCRFRFTADLLHFLSLSLSLPPCFSGNYLPPCLQRRQKQESKEKHFSFLLSLPISLSLSRIFTCLLYRVLDHLN